MKIVATFKVASNQEVLIDQLLEMGASVETDDCEEE